MQKILSKVRFLVSSNFSELSRSQSGPFVPGTAYGGKVIWIFRDVVQVALVTRDGTDHECRKEDFYLFVSKRLR